MLSPHRMLRAVLLCVTAVALTAGHAGAHEFWISPSAYRVGSGDLVRVSLFHGERFAGDEVARNDPMIRRYVILAGGTETDVRGMHGATTGFVRPDTAGQGVLVYETEEYINTLPAARFEAYLEEEGLGEISERRAALGESGAEGREAYVRCAKALVTVGDSEGSVGEERPVGLPYEIVVERAGGSGDGAVVARLLFEGEAMPGRRVVAVCRDEPTRLHELEADEDGVVRFVPDRDGVWMLTSLHMERVSETRDDIDWKSYWASSTFLVQRARVSSATEADGEGA